MQWETFLGYLTGFGFVTSDLSLESLLRTALVVNICNAIMCRVIAYNHGMRKNPWTAAGFIFGFWAVAVALLASSTRSLGDDKGRG